MRDNHGMVVLNPGLIAKGTHENATEPAISAIYSRCLIAQSPFALYISEGIPVLWMLVLFVGADTASEDCSIEFWIDG
jgi:hypothetical protein